MPKPLIYNATLVERIDLTPQLAIFKARFDEPGADDESFVPGQYVTLGLNNEEQPELGSVRRPMSIASAPEEQGALEFYIRYVSYPESKNPLTHLLWKINAGDRLFMRPGAVGTFTIPHTVGEDDTRLKVCVAAGTGLAPFVSMVRHHHLTAPAADLTGFGILHGASYPADLGYREELEKLAAERGLAYHATVSRPKEAPDWAGDVGRVEDYFLPERLAALEAGMGLGAGELDPQRAVIYICGLQGTIGQTIIRMLERGFVPENRRLRRALEIPESVPASIFFEQYDTTPVIDIKNPELMASLRDTLHAALPAAP